jgi:hypothetical protein
MMDEYSMNWMDIEKVLVVVVSLVYQLVLQPTYSGPLLENVNILVELKNKDFILRN